MLVEATPPGEDRWERLWSACPRGDWLLGIAVRLGAPHEALVRAAAACAQTVLEPGDQAATAARGLLDLVRRWSEGAASAEEVARAAQAFEAVAARAATAADDAACRAALATAMGVADPDALAGAAAFAAESTMMATLDCGLPLVMSYAHGRCADAVRAVIPWSVLAPFTMLSRT